MATDLALEKVDAVIVGAGAAGAVFAAVLTRAGKKVVLLERGPDWQLTDLISSDIWGRRLKGSGAPIIYEGRHPVGRTSDHGWGVGGAALHYSANFPRLLPADFKVKSEHGRALDWPISYADIAPYYDRIAREIGVSGDAKAEERWRPPGVPYPMPPLKTFRHGEIWVPASSRSASRWRRARSG
jgi:choline dehydrogenase-like flavoprotein